MPHYSPVHPPVPGNKPVPWHPLRIHSKISGAVSDELVRLLKRPFVEKEINPFPCRKLTRLALSLPSLRPTTLFGDSMSRGKLRQVVLMTIQFCFRTSLRSRTLSCSHRTRF